MEARLSARLAAPAPDVSAPAPVTGTAEAPTDIPEEAALAAAPALSDADESFLPGEETERAMLAELRERGEPVVHAKAVPERDEAPVRLPPLDDLVKRIPGPVRETLDELFRARFTSVRRVPAEALKTPPAETSA